MLLLEVPCGPVRGGLDLELGLGSNFDATPVSPVTLGK